jgi:hypothetical protein
MRHEWYRAPFAGRGSKADPAVTLSAKERKNCACDLHVAKHVDLEHLVYKGLTVGRRDQLFEHSISGCNQCYACNVLCVFGAL